MKKLISAFFLLALGSSSASVYHFTVDTSALVSTGGFIDFDLLPGGVSAGLVNVQISNLVTNGVYDPTAVQLTGDASGQLPDSLLLDNITGFNDAFQPFSFGTTISFLATFSGPGVDGPASPGTNFEFSIYDSLGTTPLLTTAGDGSIAGVSLDRNGVRSFANLDVNGASVATVAQVAQSTPEPATGGMLLLGLGLAAYVRRLRRESV